MGKELGQIILSYIEFGARILNLNKLTLRVIKRNLQAINLYRKQKFEVISEDNQYFYMSKDIR